MRSGDGNRHHQLAHFFLFRSGHKTYMPFEEGQMAYKIIFGNNRRVEKIACQENPDCFSKVISEKVGKPAGLPRIPAGIRHPSEITFERHSNAAPQLVASCDAGGFSPPKNV